MSPKVGNRPNNLAYGEEDLVKIVITFYYWRENITHCHYAIFSFSLYSISTEFLALMKVTKSPLVMDKLNIQGVQRSLERLADLLGKIQKALGEYLERERSSFPR